MPKTSLYDPDEVVALVNQKVSPIGIQDRLGIGRAQLFRILRERNLTGYDYVEDTTAYGIDNESHALRVRLGYMLYNLLERLDRDRAALARITGLNRQEQINAEGRPWQHNWTLAQIQRLCKESNINFQDLIYGNKSN